MPSSTFFIFILIFAFIFALVGRWLYLLYKKGKLEEERIFEKTNRKIENSVEKKEMKDMIVEAKEMKKFGDELVEELNDEE